MKRATVNGLAVIGKGTQAAQCALTLARLGIKVALITPSRILGPENNDTSVKEKSSQDFLRVWPMMLQAATHPLVSLYSSSQVEAIQGKTGQFVIRATRSPRYVYEDLCTGCGRCEDVCSVKLPVMIDGRRVNRSAIHSPLPGIKAVPSAYAIDKNGIAPCRAACPLGINVQGLACLLSAGKTEKALNLINEAAPLAGVLGRVCTHPCEDGCNRAKVDNPVFIQALHRYAADSVHGRINYDFKVPAGSRKEKIAVIGSGPSGLTAAWELARRGYNVTVFESHAVIGGMLATGIPRFRLPREVREKEVEAIRAMGVDIKTGITVGRDVTIADLRKRGYKAFFLSIGAQQNNRLNIPGEDLDGVVDCISLLFTLNLKVGASVGSKVVVIGGGNSAVDSARAAKRMSRGSVRVLYRRSAGEMTAVKEDIEDSIKEGVSIEYLTATVEILGDGDKVKGIRCQRMALGKAGADGRRSPEPVPGSEFVIESDHVVVAIGQRPNLSLLNIKDMELAEEELIKVDPLTLETSIPGIFAGGDCVRGPNNVVEAMADGLRAAESVDRYLLGLSLKKGRSLDKSPTAEINIAEREVQPYKRAHMPAVPMSKRKGNFEETNTGLSEEAAEHEASRCINCALCCECKECEQACEMEAIFHKDSAETVEIETNGVINFLSSSDSSFEPEDNKSNGGRPGIYNIKIDDKDDLFKQLAVSSAVAMQAAADFKVGDKSNAASAGLAVTPVLHPAAAGEDAVPCSRENRIGVILCHCGGGISSIIDFNEVVREIQQLPRVCHVQEVPQCCNHDTLQQIMELAGKMEINRLVIAACRCCNLEQVCFSCGERRVLLQQYLNHSPVMKYGREIEFVNIREQCAWAHQNDLAGATRKAVEIIAAGIARINSASMVYLEQRPILKSALVLGAGAGGMAAAKRIAEEGYAVKVISTREWPDNNDNNDESPDVRAEQVNNLEARGILVRRWPDLLDLQGGPGNYEAILTDNSEVSRFNAGVIILDIRGMFKEGGESLINSISGKSLLGRILSRKSYFEGLSGCYSTSLRSMTFKETAGLFIISSERREPAKEQAIKGAAVAARALSFLGQGVISSRINAVSINQGLCRGCGECAAVCPYIEMKVSEKGTAFAFIDRMLCLGCGGCIACCPTGAITQVSHHDGQITSTLEALLGKVSHPIEVAGAERTWI